MLRALAIVAALASTASADTTKAWAALKANAPASAKTVIGMNVETLDASSIVSFVLPVLLSKVPDVKRGLDLMKSECNLDPFDFVTGIVSADANSGSDKAGIAYVALKGVDEPKLTACVDAIGKKLGKAPPKITKDGPITAATISTGEVYFKWISNDVVAIASDPSSRAMLETWTTGKGAFARAGVAKLAARVKANAAAWFATTSSNSIKNYTVKSGTVAVDLVQGDLSVDARLTFANAKEGAAVAKTMTDELAKVTSGLDPNLAALVKKATIKAAGADVVINGAVPETDVLSLAAAMR